MVNKSNQKEVQKYFYCEICEQLKEAMDMHTWENGLCKTCWSKKENKRNINRGGNRKGCKNVK